MSIDLVYAVEDRSNSGGRYHRVTTYSVSACEPESTPRARPKSQILRSQFLFTSRLPGLRSRWSTFAECTALRPRRIWYTKYWMWSSESACFEWMM